MDNEVKLVKLVKLVINPSLPLLAFSLFMQDVQSLKTSADVFWFLNTSYLCIQLLECITHFFMYTLSNLCLLLLLIKLLRKAQGFSRSNIIFSIIAKLAPQQEDSSRITLLKVLHQYIWKFTCSFIPFHPWLFPLPLRMAWARLRLRIWRSAASWSVRD